MRFSIPVTPDPNTARQWAQDELSKSIYHHSESLADRLGNWFSELIDKLLNAGAGGSISPLGYLLGAIAVIGLIVIATRIAVPAAQQRRRRGTAVVLEDDARTAQQMREAAQAAAKAGDHTAATLDYFRALVRGCEERVVIDDRAGRTAREAARDIATSINQYFAELRAAAISFDALCYGHRDGTAEDSSRMRDLESGVRGTRAVQPVAS
jgi:Domain of unknown function (DUF4129)